LLNPALNEGLPPFLARNPGLESGLMMLQVTAAALVAEMRVLAGPASTGSITTSGNKEDFVSMGMTSALKLSQSVGFARRVLAIEMICACRALDLLRPLRTSPRLEDVRSQLAVIHRSDESDHPWTDTIESVAEWLTSWQTPGIA
jgi:histidine ammonia-lyase